MDALQRAFQRERVERGLERPARTCDYWLASRTTCGAPAPVLAFDSYGAPFGFCERHWPKARNGQLGSYGPLHIEPGRTEAR